MLVALISICVPSDDERDGPRGLLRFAGQTVAERQIDLALRLGCERIVCLVEGIGSEVIALQEAARAGGAKFNAVSGGFSLLGQVTAGDEILVFADGLLPQADAVERHLGERPGVLVMPAEGAVELGYERIDAEWAWAGVLRARGTIVEGLSQLAPDSDPVSALLRIALQRGTRVVPIDGGKAKRGGWLLATHYDALAEQEERYLRDNAPRAGFLRPMRAITDRVALWLAPRALDSDSSGGAAQYLGAGFGVGALAAGIYGWPVAGLALLIFASLIDDIGTSLTATLRIVRQKKPRSQMLESMISLVFEGILVTLCVWSSVRHPAYETGFLALLVLGLLHVLRGMPPSSLNETLRDRTLIIAAIAGCAASGFLDFALATASFGAVGLILLIQRRNRLTPA